MKKLLIMSIALVAIMATVFTVSAFAANTVSINEITGISIAEYKDAEGNVDDAYVTMTVTYEATADPAAEAMSRITFMLSANTVAGELEGNEAEVVYLDEMVTPDGSYTFVVEKARIQTALGKATLAEIEGQTLIFKMGGVGVDNAATVNVVYNSPKAENDVKYGDVDFSGAATALDAALVLQYDVGLITFTNEQLVVANVDGSTQPTVTSLDAAFILQLDVGLITAFPVEQVQ